MFYIGLICLLLLQEGLFVLSPEEQERWLKSKEEACSSGISSNVSASRGEPDIHNTYGITSSASSF
jgi:hypothetical protein